MISAAYIYVGLLTRPYIYRELWPESPIGPGGVDDMVPNTRFTAYEISTPSDGTVVETALYTLVPAFIELDRSNVREAARGRAAERIYTLYPMRHIDNADSISKVVLDSGQEFVVVEVEEFETQQEIYVRKAR